MSRIGKMKILIPEGVKVKKEGGQLTVEGPLGKLQRPVPHLVSVEVGDGETKVVVKGKSKFAKSLHGTYRSHLANMVAGVTKGWSKELELVGSGYRAEVKGQLLVLTVGYSHPVEINLPEGISAKVEKNLISLKGVDKEVLGEIAAKIRAVRPPEPYKGKGILYAGEVVRRKPGKAAAGAQGPTGQ